MPSMFSTRRPAEGPTEVEVGLTRALGRVPPCGATYEGDFNVSNAVCYFACNVAAGIFRVPRCRWADSPSVNSSSDIFAGTLLQGS